MSWLSNQFELNRSGESSNVRPMEGLRGFAVFLVFLVHYVSLISPWLSKNSSLHELADTMHTIGNAGVDLFFVLSGYLIYGSLMGRHQAFLGFIRRRIARIYPAFAVVFALYLALSFASPGDSKIPGDPVDAWAYVCQNFLLMPGLFRIEPIITVAWSLSYEMFYYLSVPVAFALLGLRARSTRWRVLFFAAVTLATVAYCALAGGHVRLVMFIAGILLYETVRDGTLQAPAEWLVLILLFSGLLGTTMQFAGSGAFSAKILILFATFFVVCHACFTKPGSWFAAMFSVTPLRWLGNMSYSYYLLHGLALKVAFMGLAGAVPKFGQESLWFVGLLPVMFALTLIPTVALFLLVERPQSLVTKHRAKQSPKPVPAADGVAVDAGAAIEMEPARLHG